MRELTAYKGDVTIPVYGTIADAEVYLKKDADTAIAELKAKLDKAIAERDGNQVCIDALKQKLAEKESWVKMLGEGEAALSLELEKTKQKLENAQASMYADVVDANMENHKLKRALWIARTEMARTSAWVFWNRKDDYNYNKWKKIECKCRAKAEEYK